MIIPAAITVLVARVGRSLYCSNTCGSMNTNAEQRITFFGLHGQRGIVERG